MGVSDVGDKIMLLKTIRCWRRFGDFGEMLITCLVTKCIWSTSQKWKVHKTLYLFLVVKDKNKKKYLSIIKQTNSNLSKEEIFQWQRGNLKT